MKTQIAYSDEYLKHNNLSHPENATRLKIMLNEIKSSSIYDQLELVKPDIISEEMLRKVHSKEMVELIKKMSNNDIGWIDFDTYVNKNDFEISRLAVGGLYKITDNIVKGNAKNGFALVRPPGHHATSNRSMGFCLFNNAAIVANEFAEKNKKILIFDCDVHHGNGTQDIFYNRSDVLYQSFHLTPHYPGTGHYTEIGQNEGEGYTINASLIHGTGEKSIFRILNEVFLPISKQFKPDLIIISTGYDSHHKDMLGGLNISANFYGNLIKILGNIQPKISCTLEGGYNIEWIGKCILSQISYLASSPIEFKDAIPDDKTNVDDLISNMKKIMNEYWDL